MIAKMRIFISGQCLAALPRPRIELGTLRYSVSRSPRLSYRGSGFLPHRALNIVKTNMKTKSKNETAGRGRNIMRACNYNIATKAE